MSKFLTQLEMVLMWDASGNPLANRDGRQLYMLISDLFYQSDVADAIFRVEKGFVTDLASVPRVPFVYDMLGDYAQQPAVVHDMLYSKASVPRDVADDVLLEAMLCTGVPSWRAHLIYAGVRIGGGSHYATE